MNALEEVPAWVQGNGFGDSPKFNGLRAQFSYLKEPYRLMHVVSAGRGAVNMFPHDDQPLMYGFVRSVHGDDFANPNIRTPWFKEGVRHFVSAERNELDWPTPRGDWEDYSLRGPGNQAFPYPTNLQELLYSDLGQIRAAG
jgi:hypothetical protein